MGPDDLRKLAFQLDGVIEQPHHHLASFRINGKIIATMPADGSFLNVFVAEPVREQMLGMYPDAYEKVWWGKKVMGLKVLPDKAHRDDILSLLQSAYRDKTKS